MKKQIVEVGIILSTIVLIIMVLFVAGMFYYGDFQLKYNTLWIMGKNSIEIKEKYGSFDAGNMTDDLIYDSVGIYKLRGSDRYYVIYFNEEGKAYNVEKPYRLPGG